MLGKQNFIIIDTCAGANLSQTIKLLNHKEMIKIVLRIWLCFSSGIKGEVEKGLYAWMFHKKTKTQANLFLIVGSSAGL